MEVRMNKVDPETDEIVEKKTAFFHENGKLQAVCPKGKPMFLADPFRFAPNMDCECYDSKGMPKKKGKYGCMTESEFLEKKSYIEEEMNSYIGGEINRLFMK